MAYSLYLKYSATGKIYFDGAGISAPVRGSQYSPGLGARRMDELGRETITEEIKIDLSGTFLAITAWINALNLQLETLKAGAWHRINSGAMQLCYSDPTDDSGYAWTSEVLDGWVALDPKGVVQRQTGQQLVTLRITRLDRWEHANTLGPLTIHFPGGGTQDSYGWMLNHQDGDAGHTNWGWINPGALLGDLSMRITFQAAVGGGGYMGDFLVGVGWSDVAEPNVAYGLGTVEESAMSAGSGVSKSPVSDSNSSGGSFANFAWASTNQTEVLKCTAPNGMYQYRLTDRRPFKPLMRLASSQNISDLWLQLKVLVGGTAVPVYETEWLQALTGVQFIEFPPVYLPPEGMEDNYQLDLSLQAITPTGGTKTLAVDFLQLWPVDGGFRKYKSLAYISSTGQVLDQGEGLPVCWANNILTQRRASIAAYGPPLRLMPGRTNIIAVANLVTGSAWQISNIITVNMMGIVARRNI